MKTALLEVAGLALSPDGASFVLLCFEGPDRYSLAGGLGTRVAGLSAALAGRGFETHLYFVGDPAEAGDEDRCGGRLHLHRWCQWISRYHPLGVYDGEEAKRADFTGSAPPDVVRRVARPAAQAGRRLFVLAEEWHTSQATSYLSDLLYGEGLRQQATIVWNANNTMGFERVDWDRLCFTATPMTVSRYMKHVMWGRGLNPLVAPNGIPEELLVPPPGERVESLRALLRGASGRPAFVKVGRWDPDKRWNMAVAAAAAAGARLVCKGGIEPHRDEVLSGAARLGLSVARCNLADGLDAALQRTGGADVVALDGFLAVPELQALYAAADAVLAQSGMEPFGLVGLEAMAAGALVFTGSTGEDYARPFQNAIVLDSDDPGELACYWRQLAEAPQAAARLRAAGRATAAEFTWDRSLDVLLARLDYLASFAPR